MFPIGIILFIGTIILIILTFNRIGNIRDMLEDQKRYNEEMLSELKEMKEIMKYK